MKGGFNNPPNCTRPPAGCSGPSEPSASMKGGFNNPPNSHQPRHLWQQHDGFNEGGVQ